LQLANEALSRAAFVQPLLLRQFGSPAHADIDPQAFGAGRKFSELGR